MGGLSCGVLLFAGCGPEVGPSLYEPRICDEPGPVRLMELEPDFDGDDPLGPSWSLDAVQDRWILRVVWSNPVGSETETHFRVRLLGECGEDPVDLEPDLWPLVLGNTLLACDIDDGTIYELDPRSGRRGTVVTTGLECEPLQRLGTALVMLNLDTHTLVLLDETKQATETPVPVEHTAGLQAAPALNPAAYSGWFGSVGAALDDEVVWIAGSDTLLWRVSRQGESRAVRSGITGVSPDASTGLLLLNEVSDEHPGQRRKLVFDPESEESWVVPGSATDPDASAWIPDEPSARRLTNGFYTVDGGLYDLQERTLHPYPTRFGEPEWLPILPGGYALPYDEHFVVWDIRSNTLIVDEAPRGPSSSGIIREDDALMKRWCLDDDCRTEEEWAYPLDGSAPSFQQRVSSPVDVWWWLEWGEELLRGTHWLSEGPSELAYENYLTSESWRLDTEVVDIVFHTRLGNALGWLDLGPRALLYRVEDGDRSGLYRTELPPRVSR